MLSRRSFFVSGAAAATAGVAILPLSVAARPEAAIASFIKQSLKGIAVPNETLHEFAREYLDRSGWKGQRLVNVAVLIENPSSVRFLPATLRAKYESRLRDLLTTFLFSTDFFTSGSQDPSRTSYLAYSDPYGVGCGNPLAVVY
jgi:hypothetical protein